MKKITISLLVLMGLAFWYVRATRAVESPGDTYASSRPASVAPNNDGTGEAGSDSLAPVALEAPARHLEKSAGEPGTTTGGELAPKILSGRVVLVGDSGVEWDDLNGTISLNHWS